MLSPNCFKSTRHNMSTVLQLLKRKLKGCMYKKINCYILCISAAKAGVDALDPGRYEGILRRRTGCGGRRSGRGTSGRSF